MVVKNGFDRNFYEKEFENVINDIHNNKKDIFDWLFKRKTSECDITIHIRPMEFITWEMNSIHFSMPEVEIFEKKGRTTNGEKEEN